MAVKKHLVSRWGFIISLFDVQVCFIPYYIIECDMEKLPERIRIKDIARLAGVSVGTVDRVLHGRAGVSPKSRESVEAVLQQLDYQPNMYASALATNKKYLFAYILPKHDEGSYWCDIEKGLNHAVRTYNDFHISIAPFYYDPYIPETFEECSKGVVDLSPDGVVLSPSTPEKTFSLTKELKRKGIPFVFVDSNMPDLEPLAFYGQRSVQSGYFAGSMLMLLARDEQEVVIFRHIHAKNEAKIMNQQRSREVGFKTYMTKFFPNCKILELDIDVELSPNQVDNLLDKLFIQHPNVKYGLTFNSKVGIFGEYVERRKRTDFHLLGYDLLDKNVQCLKNGSVHFLIAQQPFTQGFCSIDGLCKHLIFRKEIKQLNYMPIELLTADNIDYYVDKQE